LTGGGARRTLARVKRLIVNADDLGYDPEIDRGILDAHASGIVTSATVMVETPFSAAALRAAPDTLGVGLHAVLDPRSARGEAEAALRRQLDRFRELRGAGPTHLDSHKHAHAAPAVLEAVITVALEADLPVRAIDAGMRAVLRTRGVPTNDHFLGDAALRPAWTERALVAALAVLEDGVTEIMTHPGHRPSHAKTTFGVEREIELAALRCSAARRLAAAPDVCPCNYAGLRRGGRPPLRGT
jgi:predicted glycoside hydrolase/deacetylase ChbG (UPF0249 family)